MQPSRIPHVGLPVSGLDLSVAWYREALARAVEAGGRSVWTPRDTPDPGLRIAFVADPDGNLVELLSSDSRPAAS